MPNASQKCPAAIKQSLLDRFYCLNFYSTARRCFKHRTRSPLTSIHRWWAVFLIQTCPSWGYDQVDRDIVNDSFQKDSPQLRIQTSSYIACLFFQNCCLREKVILMMSRGRFGCVIEVFLKWCVLGSLLSIYQLSTISLGRSAASTAVPVRSLVLPMVQSNRLDGAFTKSILKLQIVSL